MKKSDQTTSIVPILCICLVYVVMCLVWVNSRPKGIFWTVDEGGKLVFLQNAIMQKDIFAPIEYPGRNLDPDLQYVPYTYTNIIDGELLSWWLPIFPILTIPFYSLWGWIGLYVIPAIGGGLTLLVTGLIVQEILPNKKWLVYLVIVVTGLATPILFYSTMFWEHTLAVAAAMLTLYLCLRGQASPNKIPFILAGFSGAVAIALRTEMVFILISIGLVQLFVDWRKAVVYGLSFMLFLVPVSIINWKTIGHPLNVQIDYLTQAKEFVLLKIGLKVIPYFLFHVPKPWTYPMGKLSMVVGSLGFLAALLMPFFKRFRIILLMGFYAFLVINWRILVSGFGYKSIHGFAGITPHIALFSWFFLNWKIKKTQIFNWFVIMSGIVFGIVFLYKAWVGAGGMQWGTRYLLVFYPILTILFMVGITEHFSKMNLGTRIVLGLAVVAAVGIGVGYQIRGLQTVSKVMNYYQASEVGLDRLKDRPVVTSYCDPALIYDGKYWNQAFFSVTWKGLDSWIEYARKKNIPSFYTIRLDICTSVPLHIVEKNRQENLYGLDVFLYEAPDYRPVPYHIP